jgi:ornithine carbamoyltransferase
MSATPVTPATPTKHKRDLLSFHDLGEAELRLLLARAAELKRLRTEGQRPTTLAGKTLGMIFEKASTRTRVSFEVGMFELGGHAVYLSAQGTQIGRGEPLRDTARVLGRYCHGIVIRTFGQEVAEELARFAPVPVINGLTDLLHPCQVLADLYTAVEHFGDAALGRGVRYAWIGDGNNMAHSWIEAAAILGLDLVLACPDGYDPDAALLAGFCIDNALLELASKNAIVLHCLPAHRGEEISDAVLEGPRSAVWAQAENRLHVQKAILERLLG